MKQKPIIEMVLYEKEQELRMKRLDEYSKIIQEDIMSKSKHIIDELVTERHRQNIIQQEIANRTGVIRL